MDLHSLLDGWRRGGPPHARLDRLLRTTARGDGDTASLARDTLGMRNQRLLRVHMALGGGALEAVAACPVCATDNSFTLPDAALLALPAPAIDAAAAVGGANIRLPRMADLLSDDPRPLAERCAMDGTMPSPDAVAQAGALFDTLDPAAAPVFDLTCPACGAVYRAAADIATFVAAALDRIVARLMREIDTIAAGYGWSEQAIVALPAARRRYYVDMILARGGR